MTTSELLNSPLEVLNIRQTSDEWITFRKSGIGGSDAAAALGISPWTTMLQLWKEKTDKTPLKTTDDFVDNTAVKYGNDTETLLFELFAIDFPGYKTLNTKNKVYKRGFMFASLDGEMVDMKTGEKGGYEGKTAKINFPKIRAKWQNGLPDYYYTQILHYFAVTQFDFFILKAHLVDTDRDGMPLITTKHFYFRREKLQEDINYLVEKEIKFWEYVEKKQFPCNITLKL